VRSFVCTFVVRARACVRACVCACACARGAVPSVTSSCTLGSSLYAGILVHRDRLDSVSDGGGPVGGARRETGEPSWSAEVGADGSPMTWQQRGLPPPKEPIFLS
jgi:hypothetical protein